MGDIAFHSIEIIGRKAIIVNSLCKSVELSCLIEDDIIIMGGKLAIQDLNGNTVKLIVPNDMKENDESITFNNGLISTRFTSFYKNIVDRISIIMVEA